MMAGNFLLPHGNRLVVIGGIWLQRKKGEKLTFVKAWEKSSCSSYD